MPDPGQLAATLGTLVVAAPAALVAALGLPSLLGRPLTERANDRACRWAIALGLVAAVGVLGLMLSTGAQFPRSTTTWRSPVASMRPRTPTAATSPRAMAQRHAR